MVAENTKNLSDDNLGNNPFLSGDAHSVTADKNGIIRLRTRANVRGVMILESPFLCHASIHYSRKGSTEIRLTRAWEFLERITVTTTSTSHDFTVDVSDANEVKIEGYWASSAADSRLNWRVNGANSSALTNCHSRYQRSAGTAVSTGFMLTRVQSAAATEVYFEGNLSLDHKLCYSQCAMTDGTTGANTEYNIIAGKWEDTASTKIKTLGIEGVVASSVLSGSVFDLYRRPQFDKTKLKLWVY